MSGLRGRARAMVRPRSLRLRALLVVILVAALPVLAVWSTDLADATVGQRLELSLSSATRRAAAELDLAVDPAAAIAKQATGFRARVTLIEAGEIVTQTDHAAETTWTGRILHAAFRESNRPSLDEIERLRPPLVDREEVKRAAAEGHVSGCFENTERRIIACHSARRTANGVVYAQQSARLPIRALYDARFQLLKVSLLVALAALMAGAWLGGRLVRPLEDLRSEVLARVDRPLTAPDLKIPRDDEFGDLATAFNQLLAEVRTSSAQNEAFVADLAHEMKNPVAAIRAASESLAGSTALTEERAKRIARIVDDSSRRLDALVTQLLELARAEAGLRAEPRSVVDVTALVAGILDTATTDPRHEHITIHTDYQSSHVFAGSSSLETALRNVIHNALSFAKSEIRVTVEGPSPVRITVDDDGPGLPEDALDKVFDRFYTSRGATVGTGLGLALTRAIVLAHEGRIFAENTPTGARFSLILPASTRD